MTLIAERLSSQGWINRSDLMDAFGISTQQASKDLQTFLRLNPRAMRYNLSAKRYEAAPPENGKAEPRS